VWIKSKKSTVISSLNNLLYSSFLFFILLSGCTVSHTHISIAQDAPQFIDDGDPISLLQALRYQQDFLGNQGHGTPLKLGSRIYTNAMLKESLAAFAEILEQGLSPVEQDRLIQKNFTVFQAGGRSNSKNNEMLVTGYFEPILEGSLIQDPPFSLSPLFSTYGPRHTNRRTRDKEVW
jgi:hypothetical protein